MNTKLLIFIFVVFALSSTAMAMRVPGDQEFLTSFFPWEFQDGTEWRILNIVGEPGGGITFMVKDGEVVEIYGEKEKLQRITKDDWKLK